MAYYTSPSLITDKPDFSWPPHWSSKYRNNWRALQEVPKFKLMHKDYIRKMQSKDSSDPTGSSLSSVAKKITKIKITNEMYEKTVLIKWAGQMRRHYAWQMCRECQHEFEVQSSQLTLEQGEPIGYVDCPECYNEHEVYLYG